MKKHGLAKMGQVLGNMSAGKKSDYIYTRQMLATWHLKRDDAWILENVQVVDVEKGVIKEERALLIHGQKIVDLLSQEELEEVKNGNAIAMVMDGKNQYLIPGLSDIHCHLSLISEYEIKMNFLHYFDAQRQRNCEFALQQGCTFVRDSAGAYDMVKQLMDAIDKDELLGPKILPSYEVMTPKGGMWDVGSMMNKAAEMIFGGKVVNVIRDKKDIDAHFELMDQYQSKSIKMYLEDKPLYGGKENEDYQKFSDDEITYIMNKAKEAGKIVETHAMFIDGARNAIKHGANSIAHLTVDEPYSLDDAKLMAKNNVAIVPTTDVGCYLCYNFKNAESQKNPEFAFFRQMLQKYVKPIMENEIIPELRPSYMAFFDFIWREMDERKMPGVGKVYPERVHGFAKCAPKSFENFLKAGVKIGMGTDGGSGVCFSGSLSVEFEAYKRYGLSEPEILRCATLGNMEILGLDKELGSIEPGKYADMVLLGKNPLKDISAIREVRKVFKNGRCYVDNEITRS